MAQCVNGSVWTASAQPLLTLAPGDTTPFPSFRGNCTGTYTHVFSVHKTKT